MPEEKAAAVADQLREFLEATGTSQGQIAKSLGVSGSTVSQFLAGKYRGDVVKLGKAVLRIIDTHARRERRSQGPQYVDTTVARRIESLVRNCESASVDEGKIALVIGDAGHGKSHCLRQFVLVNPNTAYIELDGCMSSTLIFAEIAAAFRIDASGSLAQVTRRIIEQLQNRQVVIVLDEASYLTVRQLDQLRQVVAVKARCPLILAGNNALLTTALSNSRRRGCEALDQFLSRLTEILNLDEAAQQGGNGGLYTPTDIKALYEYGGIRLTSDAVKTLRSIAKSDRGGRLRTCSYIISALHASNVVQEAGQIDRELILDAIEELGLPVRVRLPRIDREDQDVSDGPQAEAVVA